MADYGTLFQLILVVLAFVVIGMFFVVYLMVLGEREKAKQEAMLEAQATSKADADETKTETEEKTQSCAHFLGYLTGRPKKEPIPDECFGCVQAIECMNRKPEAENVSQPEPLQRK